MKGSLPSSTSVDFRGQPPTSLSKFCFQKTPELYSFGLFLPPFLPLSHPLRHPSLTESDRSASQPPLYPAELQASGAQAQPSPSCSTLLGQRVWVGLPPWPPGMGRVAPTSFLWCAWSWQNRVYEWHGTSLLIRESVLAY